VKRNDETDMDNGWYLQEENMKGNGVYITATHPQKKGFILTFGNKNDKKYIKIIKQNCINFVER
jgi:hypothetical protein